jgi:hypothetical protein
MMFMAIAADNQCHVMEESIGSNPVSPTINYKKREVNKWKKAEEAYSALEESWL